MEELKRSQGKFNTKIIGSIVVDFSSVKKKVRSKYNAWHKEVMDKFAEITNEGMKQFISLISEARSNLESNSLENEGKDIISFITEIQKFTENEKEWALEMNKFKNSKQILDSQKYRFRGEFTSMEQLESEWNKFEQILQKKQKEMDEKIPALVKQVEADKINLSQELKNLESFWAQNKPETADNPAAALKVLEKTSEKINSIKDAFIKNCTAAKLLKLESENPNRLDNITHEVDEDFKNVWNSLNIIYSKIDAKKETPFLAINPDKIKKDLDEALNNMTSLSSDIRQYKAYEITEKKLKTLKKMNTIISDLRTEAIKDRHWKEILKRLSIHKSVNDLILNDFWKAPLLEMEKHLQDIIGQATGQLVLETYIKKSKDTWGNYELDMVRYKDKCKLIRGWDDMFTLLDEHINSFQSMSNSPHYNIFKDEIEPWKDKLEKIRLLFNEWVDVQRKWVYLEGIF